MSAIAIRSMLAPSPRILFWPLVVAIGLASVAIARGGGGGFAGRSTSDAILELCAGWSVFAAAFMLLRSPVLRRAGALLAAAGCSWFLLEWNTPRSHSGVVFTVGLACSALTPALV